MTHPILDSQRQRVRELEQVLLLEKAKLEGMEAIVQGEIAVRPDSVVLGMKVGVARVSGPKGSVGKAPGQLSMAWRGVLEFFYKGDEAFSESDAASMYMADTGRDMRPRDVRRRLEGYANEHQFLEIKPDGKFRVTNVAAERFGFERSPKNGAVSDPGQGQTAAPHLFGSREGGGPLGTPTT
ncbi:hypothetical protein [Sandarakinorhabdus sp.]|uniref:hypothetical protein n=1 Tax=Sandarakinorhabdus sp. TaxID=1916663 RepID=UPI00286E5368|nr:hypothetical protein [Sandarakinorhabdus sp.]